MGNSIIVTANDGEHYLITSGSPVVGDRVLVLQSRDENIVIKCDTLNVGDKILVFTGADGEYYAIKSSRYVKITDGFNRSVAYNYEIINLGTFTFNWDGTGKVYLMSSPTANQDTDTIWVDDRLSMITSLGTVTVDNSGYVHEIPAAEITSILQNGINDIQFELRDVWTDKIGCSSLYIVQVLEN